MNVIKRSGKEVSFNENKIYQAILKANESIDDMDEKLSEGKINKIVENVMAKCNYLGRAVSVEEIQDYVEEEIMREGAYKVAKSYITYRYKHELIRKSNTTDDHILTLIEGENEEVKQENSNKNPTVNSVQRDYMAGEVSKDITKRFLLPEDVIKAHEDGIIHFHDSDYYAQHMHNCDLVNVENRLRKEITKGIQTIQYQVVTLMTTNGQAPFITEFLYLNEAKNEREREDLALIIEETLIQRTQGIRNEQGVWITPAFPKIIYVLEEDNIKEDSKYYYLTELAAKCTAKRMVPDYISEKVMKNLKEGNCFPTMGCRSVLSVWKDENGNPKFYGRFNQGVVTINLVDCACQARDMAEFWQILDERLELCHKALRCRHERLKGTPSDVAPILWQHGALARLEPGETIDKLLYGGYSTISLGYAGLWETVFKLNGHKLTEPEGEELGLKIMQYMNDKCEKWKKAENLGYSTYGTPLESTTYKFAKALQKRFGIIPGVTDKNYITNSYHIHVTEDIDAFSKLHQESKFQSLSTGGAISYVEVPNMQNNIPAVLSIMRYIYDNIMYAELNTKSDYCQVCGYTGEIQIVTDKNNKLVWECPNCKNRDQRKMNVARRTCGYIGTQFWNQGRTQEIKERKLHL